MLPIRDLKVVATTLILLSLMTISVEVYSSTYNIGWADTSFTEGWLPTTVFGVNTYSTTSDGNVFQVSMISSSPEAYLTLTKNISVDTTRYRYCIVRWKVYPKDTHVGVWVQHIDSLGYSGTSALFDDTVGDWRRLYHNVEGKGATDWVETVTQTPRDSLLTKVSLRIAAYSQTGENTTFRAFFQFIKFVMDIPVLWNLSFIDLIVLAMLGIISYNCSTYLLRKRILSRVSRSFS